MLKLIIIAAAVAGLAAAPAVAAETGAQNAASLRSAPVAETVLRPSAAQRLGAARPDGETEGNLVIICPKCKTIEVHNSAND